MIYGNFINDVASKLAKKNLLVGMNKLSKACKKLGINIEPRWHRSIDFTFTRNNPRWKSGFAYGGVVVWGSGNDDIVLLDIRANTCGFLVGELFEDIKVEKILKRSEKLYSTIKHYKDGDLRKSNHFISIYKNNKKRIFVIHANPEIVKINSRLGTGLYFDNNKYLLDKYLKISTKEGHLHFLTDVFARDYYKFYQVAEEFSKNFRREVADTLFNRRYYKIISNETHQGLLNINTAFLGCYIPRKAVTYPILSQRDKACYLVKFNDIPKDGYILPHGEGYALSSYLKGDIQRKGNTVTTCLTKKCFPINEYYTDIDKIPLEYRKMDFISVLSDVKHIVEINMYKTEAEFYL